MARFLLQIGNAVPPPMAREIGHEIKKCLVWKKKNEVVVVNGNETDKEDVVMVEPPSSCDEQASVDTESSGPMIIE